MNLTSLKNFFKKAKKKEDRPLKSVSLSEMTVEEKKKLYKKVVRGASKMQLDILNSK